MGDHAAIVTAMFSRSGERIITSLSVEDKALLVQVPDLLASIGSDDRDPAWPVVYRAAYAHDEDASEEFEQLTYSQRSSDHASDVAALETLLRGGSLISMEDAESVLRVINRARLTLAARAGVFESGSGWEARISNDPALAALAWLGYVQSELLVVLMDSNGTNW